MNIPDDESTKPVPSLHGRSEQTSPPHDAPRVLTSQEIFCGHSEVWIQHHDQMYRLRRTSAGKLYLCK
ncbi:hemin uptake protein HemP [Roseimaritima sediminicola]|uniref:hemin uptake protein HemP n=1 Tax=Roseimaritima sediminicola TaxID=2662066 RepID=UPI0012984500